MEFGFNGVRLSTMLLYVERSVVSAKTGDRFAGIPFQYVISHPGQLSFLPSLVS